MKRLTLQVLKAMAIIRETEYGLFDQVQNDLYYLMDERETDQKETETDVNTLDLIQLIGD